MNWEGELELKISDETWENMHRNTNMAAALTVNNMAKYRTAVGVCCSLLVFFVVFVVVCFNDARHFCEKTLLKCVMSVCM